MHAYLKFDLSVYKLSCIFRGVAREARRGGHPKDEEVGVRETLKSAIKSIHWKVVLK